MLLLNYDILIGKDFKILISLYKLYGYSWII